MPPVTTIQRPPTLTPQVEHRQTHFLLTLLDSVWFPWVWMALWAAAQVGHALVS